jgi:hypothetical protein
MILAIPVAAAVRVLFQHALAALDEDEEGSDVRVIAGFHGPADSTK